MNIPALETLKGRLTEIHSSENINLSKHIVPQIAKFQKESGAVVFYIDAGSNLNYDDMPYDWDKMYAVYGLNDNTLKALEPAAAQTDIIIIDSLPYYEGDVWSLLSNLRNIARKSNTAIIILNQYRYVQNHYTGEYEYKPYRFNAVTRYASLAINADTDTVKWFEPIKPQYEPFVESLLKAC